MTEYGVKCFPYQELNVDLMLSNTTVNYICHEPGRTHRHSGADLPRTHRKSYLRVQLKNTYQRPPASYPVKLTTLHLLKLPPAALRLSVARLQLNFINIQRRCQTANRI